MDFENDYEFGHDHLERDCDERYEHEGYEDEWLDAAYEERYELHDF